MRVPLKYGSLLLAALLAILLIVWMSLGDMYVARDQAPADIAPPAADNAVFRVETRLSQSEPYVPHVVIQGQLIPKRQVALRAQTAGRVTALPVEQGERVEAGEQLLRMAPEDLPARLAQAEAEVALQEAELRGAKQLRSKNLTSENDLLRLQSELAQARAEREALQATLEHMQPTAPFTGIFDQRNVELGDTLQIGETYATLVDLTQLKGIGQVPQREAFGLSPGLPVTATLLDGRTLQGTLTYIASVADEATRSYAVEALLDNPDQLRIAGASARIDVALPERQAHRLSPALLALDEQGRLGVKHVDAQDRVRFTPVELLSADASRAWVDGLPEQLRLITLGGGFVTPGQQVETAEQPASPAPVGAITEDEAVTAARESRHEASEVAN
ncbi:multidrug efflux RND transporter periplasmic adaptor subunit VmeJ [Halomonas shantousis]